MPIGKVEKKSVQTMVRYRSSSRTGKGVGLRYPQSLNLFYLRVSLCLFLSAFVCFAFSDKLPRHICGDIVSGVTCGIGDRYR